MKVKPNLKWSTVVAGIKEPEETRMEVLSNENTQTKITDINQFCLEHIFIHLDLEDLLNLSDANKYLKLATYMPFTRNFAVKTIKIDRPSQPTWYDFSAKVPYYKWKEYQSVRIPILIEGKQVVIADLKRTFQVLRCYGNMITELDFSYYPNEFENEHPEQFKNYYRVLLYIQKFCIESLRKIRFGTALGFEMIGNSFSKVHDLTINVSYLSENCLSRIFPKVCRLNLPNYLQNLRCYDHNLYPLYPIFLIDFFPNLTHFNLGYPYSTDYCRKFAENMLQWNPNLRNLSIEIKNYVYLDVISKHMQSVENLNVTNVYGQFKPYFFTIFLPNVSKFKLSSSSGYLNRDEFLSKNPIIIHCIKRVRVSLSIHFRR